MMSFPSSLPSLRPLLDVYYLPLTNMRIARTFCFANNGQALYLVSPTEIQRLTYSQETCENLQVSNKALESLSSLRALVSVHCSGNAHSQCGGLGILLLCVCFITFLPCAAGVVRGQLSCAWRASAGHCLSFALSALWFALTTPHTVFLLLSCHLYKQFYNQDKF